MLPPVEIRPHTKLAEILHAQRATLDARIKELEEENAELKKTLDDVEELCNSKVMFRQEKILRRIRVPIF